MSTEITPGHTHLPTWDGEGIVTGQTRRQFLGRLGMLAGAGVAAPFALQLGSMAPAAAAASTGGYRAIVCVFLYGGNDHWNTFVPNDDAGYAAYQAARAGLAQPRAQLRPVDPVGGFSGAGSFGFASQLGRVHDLFTSGEAAVVANVGTLLGPTSKADYATIANRPPQLFSHNDQQSFWQSGAPEGARTGWGGRIADALLDQNGDSSLFTSVSAGGNAIMMAGETAIAYQVSSRGVTTLRTDVFSTPELNRGIRSMMGHPGSELLPRAYVDTTNRALSAADNLATAIDDASSGVDLSQYFDPPNPPGPARNLLPQLDIVTRLILAGRNELGLTRQVFFVGLGGFDTHGRQNDEHPQLLESLDLGLGEFHRAMSALGLNDEVTSFTASDFGRALVSNGDGTDHGWGAHHLVVGGAVNGNRIVGDLPVVADDGPDDVGRGRLLPGLSVDQYAATLARWLGVPDNQLGVVAPGLDRFAVRDLGLF